jgi:hypothetical protein
MKREKGKTPENNSGQLEVDGLHLANRQTVLTTFTLDYQRFHLPKVIHTLYYRKHFIRYNQEILSQMVIHNRQKLIVVDQNLARKIKCEDPLLHPLTLGSTI